MVGDISPWINLQNVINTMAGALLLSAVYWGLRRLDKWQKSRKPPNPITEETNTRLTSLLDVIERQHDEAKETIAELEQQIVKLKATHTDQIADYDKRWSEAHLALVKMTIDYSKAAARVTRLEEVYTRDTGKALPPL